MLVADFLQNVFKSQFFKRMGGGDNILNLMWWFVSIIESNFIQKKSIWHSFIKLLDTASNSDVKILIQFAVFLIKLQIKN